MEILDKVTFSRERVGFEQMNILHNISDCCLNISFAEGFGLGTLEAMQTGTPIIAAKTGGLTRQVIDHRDGTENGVALDISHQTLVGSQGVPYIYEDYVSVDDVADGLFKMYSASKEEKAQLSEKVKEYVASEFAIQDTIDAWHTTMVDLIEDFKAGKRKVSRFDIMEL